MGLSYAQESLIYTSERYIMLFRKSKVPTVRRECSPRSIKKRYGKTAERSFHCVPITESVHPFEGTGMQPAVEVGRELSFAGSVWEYHKATFAGSVCKYHKATSAGEKKQNPMGGGGCGRERLKTLIFYQIHYQQNQQNFKIVTGQEQW